MTLEPTIPNIARPLAQFFRSTFLIVMSPIPNPRVILAKVPVDYPVAGEHIVLETCHTIDLDTVPLNGGYLTKTLLLR